MKVGQHIASLEYLLPREYVSTFKVFHSSAPSTPLHRLKKVILEEFGVPGKRGGGGGGGGGERGEERFFLSQRRSCFQSWVSSWAWPPWPSVTVECCTTDELWQSRYNIPTLGKMATQT